MGLLFLGGAVLPAFYFSLARWGSLGFLWWRVYSLGTLLGVLAVHVHSRGGLAGPPREGVGGHTTARPCLAEQPDLAWPAGLAGLAGRPAAWLAGLANRYFTSWYLYLATQV